MSDLLSDVLKTLRLRGALFLRGEFTEPWGVGAPGADGMAEMLRPGQGNMVVFHIVSRGRCWIRLDAALRVPCAGREFSSSRTAIRIFLPMQAAGLARPFRICLPHRRGGIFRSSVAEAEERRPRSSAAICTSRTSLIFR